MKFSMKRKKIILHIEFTYLVYKKIRGFGLHVCVQTTIKPLLCLKKNLLMQLDLEPGGGVWQEYLQQRRLLTHRALS